MTEEELEVFTQKGTDLKVYVDEYIPKFITGELSIEDDYDDYIATLEDIGVQEYMDVVHAAYDRWMER
jgi:putative aldouronate transport system substrate-binding protein